MRCWPPLPVTPWVPGTSSPNRPRRTDRHDRRGLGFAPGEWADDTSMAIRIAQAVASGLDVRSPAGLDAVAAYWIRWYDSEPTDIGNQTRAVLSKRDPSAAGMAGTAAAIAGSKAGNGSLMRTAPVALAYLHDELAAIDAAAKVSALTHDDPRANQACDLWTSAIRHAVLYGNFDGARQFLAAADGAEVGPCSAFPGTGRLHRHGSRRNQSAGPARRPCPQRRRTRPTDPPRSGSMLRPHSTRQQTSSPTPSPVRVSGACSVR